MKVLTRKRHFRLRKNMLAQLIIKAENFAFGSRLSNLDQYCLKNGHSNTKHQFYLISGRFDSKLQLCLKIGHYDSKLELHLKSRPLFQNLNFRSKLAILARNWLFRLEISYFGSTLAISARNWLFWIEIGSLSHNWPIFKKKKRQIRLKMIRLISFSIVLKMSFFGIA